MLAPGHGRAAARLRRAARRSPGLVLLEGGRTVTYKYGASDAAALAAAAEQPAVLGGDPRRLRERGFATFDFGRSDLADDGPARLQVRLGRVETPLVYTTLGGRPAAAEAGEGRAGALARTVLQHAPPWVCRAAGQLLYRYAA